MWRMSVVATLLARRLGATADGQRSDVIKVPDSASCPRCSILVTRLATLGTSDGPGVLEGVAGTVWSDRSGRFWVRSGD